MQWLYCQSAAASALLETKTAAAAPGHGQQRQKPTLGLHNQFNIHSEDNVSHGFCNVYAQSMLNSNLLLGS